MALTSITTFDVVGQTQSISFNNPGQVDQISYANNQITFAQISGFNLSKSDLLIYLQFLILFNSLLVTNFPSVNLSLNNAWPNCSFDITQSTSGVEHIIYTQNTGSTNVYTINYVPVAVSASFAARGAPVTITLQEYFSMIACLIQYKTQINLN